MEAIGIGGEENDDRRLTVLRAIDKLDRLGEAGVRALLGPGRRDDSGDFTTGAQLRPKAVDAVMSYILAWAQLQPPKKMADRPKEDMDIGEGYFRDNYAITEKLREVIGDNALGREGLDELDRITEFAEASGYGSRRIVVDPSVVRGLEYYTGPVYEIELLIPTEDEKGRPVRFGSVGGGGRYDGLVSRFRGEPVPATGFSIGVSRLQAALTLLGKLDSKPAPGPVLVTLFPGANVADAQKLVAMLRNAKLRPDDPNSPHIRAELYLGNPKHSVGQQLKYADKRGSPCAVIQGGDEKAKGEVQIKDLIAGASLTAIKDRDEYLKQQAAAQFAVSEDKLVEAVRQVLARHNVSWS